MAVSIPYGIFNFLKFLKKKTHFKALLGGSKSKIVDKYRRFLTKKLHFFGILGNFGRGKSRFLAFLGSKKLSISKKHRQFFAEKSTKMDDFRHLGGNYPQNAKKGHFPGFFNGENRKNAKNRKKCVFWPFLALFDKNLPNNWLLRGTREKFFFVKKNFFF